MLRFELFFLNVKLIKSTFANVKFECSFTFWSVTLAWHLIRILQSSSCGFSRVVSLFEES